MHYCTSKSKLQAIFTKYKEEERLSNPKHTTLPLNVIERFPLLGEEPDFADNTSAFAALSSSESNEEGTSACQVVLVFLFADICRSWWL
jgi:hypothetical protein